jgi:hypothetical protein
MKAMMLVMVVLFSWSCAQSAGVSLARGGPEQSDDEIAKIMGDLKPTERLVPNADSRLLWQAATGYMERAFPLDELPAAATSGGPNQSRQIRTRLVEWHGDGLPHRTRVFVELRPDAANAANVRLRAVALMVESEPQLEQARQGVPLEYKWRLVGSNPRIEETVLDHIMKRYLALVEGKPLPLDDEMGITIKPAGS